MQPTQYAKSAALLTALALVGMAMAFAQPRGGAGGRDSRDDGLEEMYHHCGGGGGERPVPQDNGGTGDGLDAIYERCG